MRNISWKVEIRTKQPKKSSFHFCLRRHPILNTNIKEDDGLGVGYMRKKPSLIMGVRISHNHFGEQFSLSFHTELAER